jgi:putative colanic acid biosynthesis glycosyltransferase
MRVVQINSVCGEGSTGRIVSDLHNILIEHGHESYIAYGRNGSGNGGTAIRIGTNFDVYCHVAITRLFDAHAIGSRKATVRFVKRLSELKPDVIHLHNLHGYYVNIQVLFDYLKNSDIPVVWTLHDCWAFTGHCAHFINIGCNRWETQCHSCPQKKSYPKSEFIDRSRANHNMKRRLFSGVEKLTIVTPSGWLADLASKSFLKNYNIRVIPNGIELEIFRPTPSLFRSEYGLDDSFVILGVASHWTKEKGYHFFMELSRHLNDGEVIVLVGLTEKQRRSLPANVIGIGRLGADELAKIYSAADVFLNPTQADTFPTTNLEALACGTPIITFATGGSGEAVGDGCGYVVDKGALSEVVERIREVSRKGKCSFTQHCIERARQAYSKELRFREYVRLYEELLNG